jgi:diguanylate cyclase (GGDEF)-like protein
VIRIGFTEPLSVRAASTDRGGGVGVEDVRGAPVRRSPSLRALMASSPVGMGFLDTDFRFVEGNRALAAALGVDALVGLALAAVSPSGARTESLVRGVLRSGRPITVDARMGRVSFYRVVDRGGAPLGIGVVTVGDSVGRRHLAQLKVEAETDGLTGLVNHRAFQERLRMEFNRALRHDRPLSLAMVDVDGFKQLNDTFGHQVGDDALQRVATHLTSAVRVNDTVARVGGDEFALLLPETKGDAAQVVIERAHARIRKDTRQRGSVDLTVSIGICDMRHARTADDLLRFADGALYWAKAHGRDAVYQYSPETVEDLSSEQRSERLLRDKALAGIRSLARAIDAKDHSTLLHSERVASLSARLAEALNWPPLRVAALREAALIHDVGKIGVPLDVLLKPGALTPDEYTLVKSHALLGAIISGEVLTAEQTSWVRGHHERFDGTGYPDGLAGDAIPDGALLLGLADGWDVMTSERAYSRAMNTTEAIAECRRCAGTHFSPAVVEILTRPGFERVLRMFANEQATLDRNEARLAHDAGSTFTIHCECGAEDCPALVEIPAEEYRSVRRAERRYIVRAGHEIAEIEETLVTTDGYSIVEKV